MDYKEPKIFCLIGPTASGKTKLAIELVQRLPLSIISVDSGMVYKGMDIGTAKPTKKELAIAPHRLIDVRDPSNPYSAGQFRMDVLREIADILANNKTPLLVGGTMLYFKVLYEGISNLPNANPEIRAKISAEAAKIGWSELHKRLAKIDPITANAVKPKDSQRIQRALEVFELTNIPISTWHREQKRHFLPYDSTNIGLMPKDRITLHNNIGKRITDMFNNGLIDEVKKLCERPDINEHLPAMRAIGYRQVWQYLHDELKFEDLLEKINVATRQSAKRQLTWLRHWFSIKWFYSESPTLVEDVTQFIKNALLVK